MPKGKHAEEILLEGCSKGRTGDGGLAGVSSIFSVGKGSRFKGQKLGSTPADNCNELSIYVNSNEFPKKFSFLCCCQSLAGMMMHAAVGIAHCFAGTGIQSNVPFLPDAATDSSADVFSEDTDSDNDVAVAVRNLGNLNDLVAHLIVFIKELTHGAKENGVRRMSFCMILWIDFLKDARYNNTHVENMERWLEKLCTEKQIGEEEIMPEIHLRVDQKVVAHRHPQPWQQVKDKMETFRAKPCIASIAIIDHMVQDLLKNNPDLKFRQDNVVRSWYTTSDDALSNLLRRANRFLNLQVEFVDLLLKGFTIQSYVAFMRMSRLAACLLFGYLETCKFESSCLIGAAGGQGGRDTLSHGFCTFVSSAGQTDADMPAQSALPTIVEGLQCLTHLPASDWTTLGPVKTARQLVADEDAQPQEDVIMERKV